MRLEKKFLSRGDPAIETGYALPKYNAGTGTGRLFSLQGGNKKGKGDGSQESPKLSKANAGRSKAQGWSPLGTLCPPGPRSGRVTPAHQALPRPQRKRRTSLNPSVSPPLEAPAEHRAARVPGKRPRNYAGKQLLKEKRKEEGKKAGGDSG